MKKISILLALVITACADTASAQPLDFNGSYRPQKPDTMMVIRQQNYYQQQQIQNQQEMLRLQRESNQRQNREYLDKAMTQPLRDFGIYGGN
jgi:hypothetical protein